ncbi:serine hydrolase domain-containing protein [Acinetobacter variabilis]|uniref:serine hydrolase domain-containing protein n=1 Tax=Acinetobacter variabilis TaxID=70346 RepID=UPI003D77C92D
MRKLEIYEILVIIFISAIIMFCTHFVIVDRVGFWRLIYPLQAKIVILNINCSENHPKWMKESLKFIIKYQKTLSNQIVYIDKNQTIYTCQSGWKNTLFISNFLNENTRFRYASLTKIFTSNLILNHINKGEISIDSKLMDFLPEIQHVELEDNRIKNITIGDLLEHRSGFDRMRSEDVVFAINKKSWCPYEIIKLTELKLDFNPGQRYAYDNRNYCLLGVVLERLENKSYRDYAQQYYHLHERNISFVEGYYYPDEVKYDFRNNNFWLESHDNKFDFKALSSSAGLSGSAKQLAILIRSMLNIKPYNILSINQNTLNNCDIEKFKSCNGYAMWQYRSNLNRPIMYFRNGRLPAVTSLALVTEKNEVFVWVGNGAPLYDENYDDNLLEKYFYKILNK